MSLKQLIIASTAAITFTLPAILPAESTEYRNAAEDARAATKGSVAGDQFKDRKVEEATAADAKYQANRTEANRVARDRAEQEAADVIDRANEVDRGSRR